MYVRHRSAFSGIFPYGRRVERYGTRPSSPSPRTAFPASGRSCFFWPKDFTFVCPTEIAAFGKLDKEFKARDAQVLGASIDSEFVLLAWRSTKDELKNLPFPMLSDLKRELTDPPRHPRSGSRCGAARDVHRRPAGCHPLRLRHGPHVGRNPEEVIRVLDALQTDELCPCNWKKGEGHPEGGLTLTDLSGLNGPTPGHRRSR